MKRGFENVCEIISMKDSESLEKNLARAIYKEEKWRKERKRALYNLRMSKLQEIFTTVVIVCHCYERLAVLQNVSPLFCFEQEKTLKNFPKKLYTSKIRKKRRSRDEI